MGYVKGVVERISIGTPIEPKDPSWSKSAKLGLQIDGKWWNGFVSEDKRNGSFAPKDKEYNVITEGMEVEFMTVEKNGYENIDKATMQIVSAPQQQAPAPNNPPQPVQKPYRPTESDAKLSNAISATLWAECLKSSVSLLSLLHSKDNEMPKDVFERAINGANLLFNKATDQ